MYKFLFFLFLSSSFIAQSNTLQPNSSGNLQVINALIEAGSDPKKLHQIEHHFYCFDNPCIESLKSKGKALGYELANFGRNEYEGVVYWYGDLVVPEPLDIELINKTNVVMLQIAREIGAEYDGWGTLIVQ